jgi:tetratricopeptide (TPR) repeat protein
MRNFFTGFIFAILIASSVSAGAESINNYPPAYASLLRDAVRSFSERDFATAVALINKADSLHAPTPMSLNVRGAVAIEEKRFDEGRTLCLDAMKLDPHFFPARFNLGEIPFVQGKYAEARNIFQKLQDENPKDELLQFRIYLTYLLEKNEAAAKDALEHVPFLSNTPIYYYSHAAWEFAHGNEKVGKEWVDRGNWVFPPFRTRNFADVFFDLGWLQRPGAPAVTPPTTTTPSTP